MARTPRYEEPPLSETEAQDAELSALLDGALSAADEAALRDRMARDPALAERFAELGQVAPALRGMAEPEISPERLVAMRSRLASRIAADDAGAGSVTPDRVAAVIPLRRMRRPAFALAAALAAGLALYLAVGRSPAVLPGNQPSPSFEEWAASEGGQDEQQLAQLSDEELAIVLQYEVLEDYELIESLDVLEMLALLEDTEPM